MALLKDLIVNGIGRFIGVVHAPKFITDGGTHSQFVKGDGTLDSNTYLTSQDISGKADKSTTVTNVSYDSTSKKIQKTINGTTSDVVTLEPEVVIHEIDTSAYPDVSWSDIFEENGLTITDSTLYNTIFQEVADGKEVLIQAPMFFYPIVLRLMMKEEGQSLLFSNTCFIGTNVVSFSAQLEEGNIIFFGSWDQYLSSLNSTTDNLAEGSNNLYFTNARAQAALSSSLSGKLDKLNSSTDNAVVRFDGTTGAIQNSGVTIDDSGNITATSFKKSGGTASQFLKANGSVDSNNYAIASGTSSQFLKGDGSLSEYIYPKQVAWPLKDHKHSVLTCLETLIKDSGVNVFAFLKPSYIDVEYSTDGGTTWIDYGLTSQEKINFCTKTQTILVGKKSSGERTNNDKARVTFHIGCGLYCHAQLMILYGMFAGGCSIRVEYTTIGDPSTYIHWNTQDDIGDNPGYVVIPMDRFLFGNNQVNDLRIILSYTGSRYTSNQKSLQSIRVYSNNTYSAPSNMARTGHLYDWTADQEMIVPNTIYPTSNNVANLGTQSLNWKNIYSYKFIKSGGTSSQFLKADGSSDSTAYAPLASPALTGTPTAPTASTNTNTTQIATTAFVNNAVQAIMNASPATLQALNDLATALGNDPNLATTLSAQIAAKYTKPVGGIPSSDLAEPLVHLTQEEYDALSTAEKNNGSWYFIEEEE